MLTGVARSLTLPLSFTHTRVYATINGLTSPAAKPGYSISI